MTVVRLLSNFSLVARSYVSFPIGRHAITLLGNNQRQYSSGIFGSVTVFEDGNWNILHESRRFKGHAHWQNIARTKLAKDVEKSQIISRLMARLKSAVFKNKMEMNPKYNKDLANVLEECASNNVPKETIKRAFDRLTNAPPAQTEIYDICGRNGICVAVEIESALPRRKLLQELKKMCSKLENFGVLDTQKHEGFQELGMIKVFKDSSAAKAATSDNTTESSQVKAAPPLTLEDTETLAIELECEEVHEIEPDPANDEPAMIEFTCSPANIHKITGALRSRGYVVQSSDVEFHAWPAPITVSPQLEDSVKQLYAKLEEIEGIGRIFDNIDWNEES